MTVVVYDTVEALRKAGARWDRRTGMSGPANGYDEAHGLAQTHDRIQIGKDGSETSLPDVGFIRLYKGSLRKFGIGLIAHEVTHVACDIYGRDISKTLPHRRSERMAEKEEQLAYMIGDLTSQIVWKLQERKLYV